MRTVIKDVRTVEQSLLYNCLSELKSHRSSTVPLDPTCTAHLNLLIKYIETTYADTATRLLSLLTSGEITYDLLWPLFKLNATIFTTCHGTHKPRCVRYDFGEEKSSNSGSRYWNMEYRYKYFDGKEFGDVSIELQIPKFRGVKRINLLEVFPLKYHSDAAKVEAELTQNGRKFVKLIGSSYRQYQGTAFFIHKGKPVEFTVNGRVMTDTIFFRKINPNYSRLKITEPTESISVLDPWEYLEPASDNDQGGSEASLG
ncbi:hypothetical protein G7Y89_g8744 [Cudoniella acicularis]|uniref:DUF7025 domain-containing protein n=1 Tax=Cudoniella acicularis TaxID=354080 RepID=A0A8H4RIL9_9HELO|nr:hypothetical protein G7Y89_g8744 [Cudoniella acicularis]